MYNIIINRATRKLSLYKDGKLFRQYTIAVGKASTPTPVGVFKITDKLENPDASLGARWIGLSLEGYAIHGTNNPSSIGKAISDGSIRLYNRNIIELFTLVPIGTSVTIL